MSDDFDFNRDDLFDDFDDDNELGGGDFGGDDFGSDSFDFGDDNDDFNLDDDFGSDLDAALGGDDDFGGGDDFATTDTAQGGGTSRTFIIIAVMMFIILLSGIGLIVYFLVIGPQNPEQLALTATTSYILTENAARQTQIVISETAAVDNATATEGAIQTATAQYTPPTATFTPSPSPTEDLNATSEASTREALDAQETALAQQEADANATATAFELTLNPRTEAPTEDGSVPTADNSVSLSAVQQTSTALAALFGASPTPEQLQPTSILPEGTAIVIGGATTTPSGSSSGSNLPDTGLFDDVFQGNPALIFLAAFGLLGVIVVSRTVRGGNKKRKD